MPTILGKIAEGRHPLIKLRVTNDVPEPWDDDLSSGPPVVKHIDVMALVDTGATNSAIDEQVRVELMLHQKGSARVLYPDADDTILRPLHPCSFLFFEHYSAGSKIHEWPDVVDVLAFDLERRVYQAIIGMDILANTKVGLEKTNSISITY